MLRVQWIKQIVHEKFSFSAFKILYVKNLETLGLFWVHSLFSLHNIRRVYLAKFSELFLQMGNKHLRKQVKLFQEERMV